MIDDAKIVKVDGELFLQLREGKKIKGLAISPDAHIVRQCELLFDFIRAKKTRDAA